MPPATPPGRPVPESRMDRGEPDDDGSAEDCHHNNGGASSDSSFPAATHAGRTPPASSLQQKQDKIHQIQPSYGALFAELPLDGNDATAASARECRICLSTESDDESDLIAPCKCRGTARWVHRSCLDRWRYTQEDRAFAQCTECHFCYLFEEEEEDGGGAKSNRRLKYRYWTSVVRDTIASLLGVALLVAALSTLVWAFGVRGPSQAGSGGGSAPQAPNGTSTANATDTTPESCDAACQVGFSLGGGICILLTVLGCYGLFLLCVHDCSPQLVMDDIAGGDARRQRGSGGNCCAGGDCCSGCYCGSCDCGGGGNDECCVFVVLIFGIIILAIGFFVGMVMAVAKVRYTLRKYSWMLQKRRLAKDFRVKDLRDVGDAECGNAAAAKPLAPPGEQGSSASNGSAFLKELGLLE